MKYLPLLAIASTLTAAPINDTSAVTFSNFQSSADVSITYDYAGFGGFAFGQPSVQDNTIYLPLGGGGYLRSNPTAQSISAQASVDFSAPGYRITAIQLWGSAVDDGGSAGEAFGITVPCSLSVSGSESYGNRNCTTGGLVEGTISAWLRMYSDASGYRSSRGQVGSPMVVLTMIHNPEPEPMILLGLGLIAIWAISKKVIKA